MRNVPMTRDEAESLVDLLEDCDPKAVGTWRHSLAADVREAFGMNSFEESQAIIKILKENTPETAEKLLRDIGEKKIRSKFINDEGLQPKR